MLVVPMAELLTQLDDTLSALGTTYMKLFVDPAAVPGLDSVASDFDAGRPAWCDPVAMGSRVPATRVDPAAVCTWPDQTFTNSSGSSADIYGYAVVDSGNATLYWAELNGSAPVTVSPGQTYTVRPYYSRQNQT